MAATAKVAEAIWEYDAIAARVEARYHALDPNLWEGAAKELVQTFRFELDDFNDGRDHLQPPQAFTEAIFRDVKSRWAAVEARWRTARDLLDVPYDP